MKLAHPTHRLHAQAAAAALSLLVLVSPAVAADAKVMSGWECLEVTAIGNWKSKTYENNQVPVASNTGSPTLQVVCPLVRDNTATSRGLSSLIIKYYQGGSPQMSCTPYTVNKNGQLIKAAPQKWVSSIAVGARTMSWTGTELGGAAVDAFYFVHCRMAMGTSILSVRYEEY